jgi:hypothetical protein
MNNGPRAGDPIRLIAMPDDLDPIEPGATRIVTHVCRHGDGRDAWLQIDVEWDDGRTLMLSSPPDRYEIVDGGE